ncbi:PhzF family phenazine biosynthesis protein [Streptomyces sannanensis]|uniref:PhzF family phenazine biosynthesis protein n=1 Tax=Streptomyces sannanensis TaxID=285536 RepID=A0ABP6S8M1_9ACTN
MNQLDVLRVFCGPDGLHGNALGVVRDGRAVPGASRQSLAAELGFSETVFVDDPERGVLDIYTPSVRLPFAGHSDFVRGYPLASLVGTAWLLDIEELHPPAGEVWARHDGEFTWITARPEWAAGRRTRRYATADEVDALPVPPPGERSEMGVPPDEVWGRTYAWAWEDEAAGLVRARAFPGRIDERGASRSSGAGACAGGIDEDEATGNAALVLSAELGRALNIRQGAGSQILTAPGPDGTIEIGGRVRLVAPAAR